MKKILYFVLISLTVGYAFSCKDMDNTYKEFIIPDGIIYPQKADSVRFYSGLNRAKLAWLKPVDPKVVTTKIFWNNYADSVSLNIARDRDTINYVFDYLEEASYTFNIVTYDAEGNRSLPVEISGNVYGDIFLSSLSSQGILSAMLSDGDGKITYAGKSENLIFSELRYKTNQDEIKTIRVLPDETSAICEGVKRKALFEYRSAFCPPGAIDTFYTEWSFSKSPFIIALPKTDWIADASSHLPNWGDGVGNGSEGGFPRQAIDGDIRSAWHSDPDQALPHWLLIDMNASQTITRLELYLHPTYQYANRVQLFTAEDPAEENWELVNEFTFPSSVTTTWDFPDFINGRYLILKFIDSKAGEYANFAEINAFGV